MNCAARFALVSLVAAALVPGTGNAQEKVPLAVSKTAPRLLFVIDADTEEPLDSAEVKDMVTRNSMKTNKAGVIGLFFPTFVKESGALIEVSKPGYLTSTRTFVDVMEPAPLIFALINVDSPKAKAFGRQRGDSTVFEVEVLDDDGGPMADAIVSIVTGLANVLASRTTDSAGFRELVVPGVVGEVQLSVTRLGFRPYRQFYRLSAADTVIAQVAMRRLATELEAVTVTARRVTGRKVYHIDELEIAASKRPIGDALDVVRKLRPSMFGDRLAGFAGCGRADFIFVNGKRILYVPQVGVVPRIPKSRAAARSGRGTPTPTPGAMGRSNARMPSPPTGTAAADSVVLAVLAAIKPEHIAEMTYVDCFDTYKTGARRDNAIYVVLKTGVEYDLRRGSRMYDQTKPKK
jgi:hypothetical protein